MKKIVPLFLLLCFIFMLTSCKQSAKPTDTPSDIIVSNTDNNKNSTNEDETKTDNNESSTDERESNDPYPMIEILDDKITIDETKKTFNAFEASFSVPIDWKCLQQSGEDGTSYFFRDPKLNEKCQLVFYITGSEYFNGNTNINDEYLEHLAESFNTYGDEKLNSITKEEIDGYECVKYVSTYLKDNINYIKITYNHLIFDVRMYNFSICYPVSECETFEPIFDSIINSIKFKTEQ